MICDPFDYLRVNYDLSVCDKVRRILADFDRLVDYVEAQLLVAGNRPEAELDDERILVRLLVQPVSQAGQDLERGAQPIWNTSSFSSRSLYTLETANGRE